MVGPVGLARIRWNTKMSGFHQIRPIVKLAYGTWLIGDCTDGSTRNWIVSEFNVADVRWLRLDIAQVVTKGNIVENVDLTQGGRGGLRRSDAWQRTRRRWMGRRSADGRSTGGRSLAPAALRQNST